MLTNRKPRRRHLTMTASLVIALLDLQAMAAGEIDLSFTGSAVRTHNSNPTELRIASSVVLPDGKILVGDSFTSVGSHARKGVVRLNSDGTVDTTFNPPQIDGSILFPNFTIEATVTALRVPRPNSALLPISQPRMHSYTDD